VTAVIRELAIPVEIVDVDIFKGEAKSTALHAKSPNGKVPVLEDDGFVLSESNAILACLASQKSIPTLLPMKLASRI
jgi:glutathione S-transferase